MREILKQLVNSYKMKNISKLILLSIFLSAIFTNCKKGDDDPFLSLRTRTNRLSGEWKLTGADLNMEENSSYSHSTTHTTYNNGIVIISETNGNTTDIDSLVYTQFFNIDKNGTFNQKFYTDTDTGSREGNWTWLSKNKELGLKNKEAFILTITKEVYDSDVDTYSGKYIIPENIYVLKELSNEKLVITIDYTKTDIDGNVSYEKGTLTYTKQ